MLCLISNNQSFNLITQRQCICRILFPSPASLSSTDLRLNNSLICLSILKVFLAACRIVAVLVC